MLVQNFTELPPRQAEEIFSVVLVLWQLIDLSMKSVKFYEDFPLHGNTEHYALSFVFACKVSKQQREKVMRICQNRHD